MSPYAYGEDNPLSYLDPSGLVAEEVGKGLTVAAAAFETGLSVFGAGASVAMLATLTVATPIGWVAFGVATILTASHVIGAVGDVAAFAEGDYARIGNSDPLYKMAERAGPAGTYALMAVELVAWGGLASSSAGGRATALTQETEARPAGMVKGVEGQEAAGIRSKPTVTNLKLQEAADQLYHPGGEIGSGSTADAIRYEAETGLPVKGKFHTQKGMDRLRNLERILASEDLSPSDRAIAEALADDLRDALSRVRK